MSDSIRLFVFETPIGYCGFMHVNQVLQRLRVGFESLESCEAAFEGDLRCVAKPDSWEKKLARRLADSLDSDHDGKDDFLDVVIADDHLTPFQKSVSDACRRIGFGQIISYGQLADQVGHPGAARAVGSVMSRNLFLLIVPCHRVLGSNGLGGYSAPGGTGTKLQLLQIEGHQWPAGKSEIQAALF